MSLSAYIYGRLINDATLQGLGVTSDTVFQGQTLDPQDAKEHRLFVLLAWRDRVPCVRGQRGVDRSYEQMLDLYYYTRDKDWTPLRNIAKRLQELADEIVAEKTGVDPNDGWISCGEWSGEMADDYDEVYEALSHVTSINFVANGA